MRGFLPAFLLGAVSVATAAASTTSYPHPRLGKRDDLQTCSDLTIANNNGDRKVVIVIDSSGSMSSNDPGNLRLSAARALDDFLISNSEAGGNVKPDQVAVVGFSGSAYSVFEPGDPGDPKVKEAIGKIKVSGSTYIAGGVAMAMDKIAVMSGPTKDRSSIVVYTDGSDSSTSELVRTIKNATAQGIRVSFGYLDDRASAQPKEVLLAVRESKGIYATITVAAGSINFVNYVLLNGLSYQDNPQGAGDRLLAGLASTQFISGSNSVSMKYFAEQGERANFTLVSFTGDTLNMEARMNGQTLNSTSSSTRSTSRKILEVTPPSNGELEIVVTASNSPKDGLFSIVTGSTSPIKNCTVGVGGGNNTSGLSTGAKAGVGVGVAAAVLGLLGAGFAAYKHFHVPGNTTSAPVGANTTAPAGGYGDTTGYYPGAEKMGPETTASSLPTNHTGGFEGNMTGQAPGGGPPATGPPMEMPPPVAPYSVVPPFVPPVIPPMAPNHTGGKDSPSQHSSYNPPHDPGNQTPNSGYQQPYSPGNNYQQPYGPGNQFQQPLGDHNGYQNHTNSPFQGNHINMGTPFSDSNSTSGPYSSPNHTNFSGGNHTGTGTPFSDANSTSGPYQSPNHTGFNGGNHTNWGPANPSNPSTGPSPAPGPGQQPPPPFFTMPSPPTWQQQPGRQERKHHHHEWLAPDSACEHPDCPLVAPGHQCSPSRETCVCTCRDPNCLVTRRGL